MEWAKPARKTNTLELGVTYGRCHYQSVRRSGMVLTGE